MTNLMERVLVVLGLMAIGALAGILVVAMVDPDCGPSGTEQTQCSRQLMRDLRSGGR